MSQAATIDDHAPFDVVALFTFTGVCAAISLLITAFTPDPLFRFHGYILMGASLLAVWALAIGMTSKGGLRSDQSRYADGVVRAGVIATMFWAVVGLLVGALIASQ